MSRIVKVIGLQFAFIWMANGTIAQEQAAKNFGQIQDIKRSGLYKTTTQHLKDIRKRELMQKRLHNTVNHMNSNQLDDFVKKTS